MSYIDNWFHFYSTTESFEVHRKQGLINPDSICFLKETGQIYTQNSFFGICRERYEKLEQLVLDHDAKIKDILGIEGPSVKDGIVNNIADLVNFLDGFTDEDNLKDFLDAMRTALENQISAVNKALSDRITALEDEIHNDSESLHNAINAINSQIETIDIRLDNHDTAISALNTSLASHIREYNLLKTNYENFKAYAETKFTAIDSSISSINISIATLQQEFTNLDEKFDDVENEVSEVKALLEDAKLLVRELEDRFGETLAAIEQFKKDVNDEIDDFKALVGAPNGMAPLDGDAKVPAAYLPSYVDDVLEYATRAAFPVTGETGKIYVSLDDNLTYRWSGSTYIEISKSLGLGETATTAYPGNKGKKNADDIAAHKADTNNPHNVTKTQLGLDKVNNTSDADKPVSTAQAAAIKVVQDDLTSHKGNKANPHEVTKAQVGLSNVDNTADLDKPISKATQAALDVLDTSLDTHIADKTNPHNVTKEQLGLGNVENTADKDKPISDATQNVLDTKVDKIVGKGLSTNDFTNEDKAKLDRATTVNDEGKISAELIPVDEEDLTVHSITDTNKVIRLKDRDTANGMGYKILRLSEELDNILTQDMINEPNTIYEIRYDFDLAGDTITIPENCVLKFEGGKLSNGKLIGNSTALVSSTESIFMNVSFEGSFRAVVNSTWFIGNDTYIVYTTLKFLELGVKQISFEKDREFIVDLIPYRVSKQDEAKNVIIYVKDNSGITVLGNHCKIYNPASTPGTIGLLNFTNCSDIVVQDISLQGEDNYEDKSDVSGWVLCALYGDCSNIYIAGKGKHLRTVVEYGKFEAYKGTLKNCNFNVELIEGGYGVALYGGESIIVNIRTREVHRSAYLAGVSNSTINADTDRTSTGTAILLKDTRVFSDSDELSYVMSDNLVINAVYHANADLDNIVGVETCNEYGFEDRNTIYNTHYIINITGFLYTAGFKGVNFASFKEDTFNVNLRFDVRNRGYSYFEICDTSRISGLDKFIVYLTASGWGNKCLPICTSRKLNNSFITLDNCKGDLSAYQLRIDTGYDTDQGENKSTITIKNCGILTSDSKNYSNPIIYRTPDINISNLKTANYAGLIKLIRKGTFSGSSYDVPDWNLSKDDAGISYFNTALSKQLFWNGTEWVDPVAEATSWKIIR